MLCDTNIYENECVHIYYIYIMFCTYIKILPKPYKDCTVFVYIVCVLGTQICL